ncbi:MAG: gliding motility-associated C-terminal domain-containing protein [Bacteroidales bacterium]|nr:gliding motility-associated C-terminal domain-containing protein [Bacteroidales bacterium]
MKQGLKYILLIIIAFSFGRTFSQSLIEAKLTQADTICKGTIGVVKIAMHSNNTDQKVACFRLMFKYDATLMQIKSVTTKNAALGNFEISYPNAGECVIMDSLANPLNFYDANPINTTLVFEIAFNGIQEGVGKVSFVSDSCYFKTEDDENIAAFYHDSPEINVHSGFSATVLEQIMLEQIGIGCSYETKGRAMVTLPDDIGFPPYDYVWSDGVPQWGYPDCPNRRDSLPEGEVSIRVIDVNGCAIDTLMMIETLRAPDIDWAYETLYSSTPEFAVKEHPIRFYVTKFDDGYNWEWKIYFDNLDTNQRDSLDRDLGERKNETDFNYVFLEDNTYEVQLKARSQTTGCDTIPAVTKIVTVEPAQLEFKNLVTPGSNRFKIHANGSQKLRDVFVSHSLIIQDRTGRKVYETKDFPDDGWDGGGCPNGTYYFILKANSTRKEYKYQGALVILGGH